MRRRHCEIAVGPLQPAATVGAIGIEGGVRIGGGAQLIWEAVAVTLSVSVLGPVTVERSGCPVAIGGAKLQLLLAVLVAHRAGTLTPGQLCDALWGDSQPAAHDVSNSG